MVEQQVEHIAQQAQHCWYTENKSVRDCTLEVQCNTEVAAVEEYALVVMSVCKSAYAGTDCNKYAQASQSHAPRVRYPVWEQL